MHLQHVGRDSLCGLLAEQRHRLFRDEDYEALCSSETGRPSVPPSQLCVALILQTKDRVSDEEAIERSEHRIARLEQLGIRQARYFGRA